MKRTCERERDLALHSETRTDGSIRHIYIFTERKAADLALSPMDGDHLQPLHRKKPPWVATVVAQAAICLALYATLNLASTGSGGRGPRDLYFLSVRGGLRSPEEQTRLLRKMDGLATAYRIEFVVNLSEFGEKDPLLGNATLYFPSLKMPWYNTGVSRGSDVAYFKDQITFRRGYSLDIIGVDTGLWQDVTDADQVIGSKSKQYSWLMRTLAVANGTWHIVVGFHGLINCKEGGVTGKVKQYDQIHLAFVKHGVNAYLSTEGCTTEREGVSYIGNLGVADEHFRASLADADINGEMQNGFAIHRISQLEIESYFVSPAGEVISQYTLRQRGKQSM